MPLSRANALILSRIPGKVSLSGATLGRVCVSPAHCPPCIKHDLMSRRFLWVVSTQLGVERGSPIGESLNV